MSEQLSERGKSLVEYMPQAVNALADLLMARLEERLLYGEKPQTKADVVEVVRCKNCKHRRAVKWANGTVNWECVLDSGDPYEQSRHAEDDNWFCGDGEARE